MRTEADELRDRLFTQEERLLNNEARKAPASVAELVEDGCVEIDEAGRQVAYRSGDALDGIDGTLFIMSDSLRLLDLSADCKLLVYVASKVKKYTRTKSSCSSVWKKAGGTWKVVFHQRTACLE